MKTFKKTYIEITNACNLSCGFCPKTKRRVEYMTPEIFETILHKLKGHSRILYFHVMGEPLLHPQIGMFLDLCDKYGYKVNLTTNGTLIDKALEIISKPVLRQVNFSLHSKKEDMGYLDRIFSFIDRSKEEKKLLIALRLWNHKEGKEGDNKEVLKKIQEKFCPGKELVDRPSHVRGVKIGENIFLNQSFEFEWPGPDKELFGGKGFCNGLRDQVAILVDGTVVPCCLDAEGVINLGNIKENSLQDIFTSKRAKDFYNSFARKEVVEPLCERCGYRARFNKGRLKP